jgi:glutathionylspermidine synthase
MSTLAPEVSIASSHQPNLHPLRAGRNLEPQHFSSIRRTLLLKYCKWDPQVGDVSTIAPFPFFIDKRRWSELETLAETLTRELLAAELELLERDELHAVLAIPRALRQVLRRARQNGITPSAVRVMRFDFHWTESGWRISEVNADVPGGFSEASEFTRLMSEGFPGASAPGNPARFWADRIAGTAAGQTVALLAAAGFMEDQQVVSYLARVLRELGVDARPAGPLQLQWKSGRAYLNGRVLGAIVRFYQAEWLSQLPRRSRWPRLLAGGRTPVSNPLSCIFGESKRFPLVWDLLHNTLPTWQRLLPETRDPRDAHWRTDDSWLLKTAWCNTGDTVSARGLIDPRDWRRAFWSASFYPRQWVAQRRFEPAPVASPIGDVYPCIGVYTIDGRACGAYTRISKGRVIDHRAIDAALLLTETRNES